MLNTILTVVVTTGVLATVIGFLAKWLAGKYLAPIVNKNEKNKKTATDIAVIISRIVHTSHSYLTTTNVDEVVEDIFKQVLDELDIDEAVAAREIDYQIQKLGGETEVDNKLKEASKNIILPKAIARK